MLCHDRQAGGIPVQTVAAAEDKGFLLFLVIPCKRICHGIVIVIQRRMYGHSRRLINHDNILILIYDLKRNFYRRNLFRAPGLGDLDRQTVGGGKGLAHVRMDAVYQNALRHPLDGGKVLGRVASPFQILFSAKSCVGFGYFIMNGSIHCISPINSIKYNRRSAY